MEFLNVLTREEMKNVKGGANCGVYFQGEWYCGYTVSDAQFSFEHGGADGYCCASCGESPYAGSPCGPGQAT